MYSYIVVGGGSAGCVVASRLSEDPNISVCLLEAGGKDKNILIHAPIGAAAMLPTKINNWAFQTIPQQGLNGRRGYQPRGKTLGGSSSTNAMLYVRGNRWDYDNWAAMGNDGWSYQDVLPYFIKAEGNQTYSDQYHGTQGPLTVSDPTDECPLNELFLEACEQHGLKRNDDYNGKEQEGCCLYQRTIRNGERCSAAKAYLTPNLNRPNLTVITNALTEKVLFKNKQAVGVRYRQAGKCHEIYCNKEIILSSGAFGSPQVLMLSGIGDKVHLKSKGVPVVHHLPGVGQNLQDHIDYVQTYRLKKPNETFGFSVGGALDMALACYRWLTKRTGKCTSTIAESGGFFRTDEQQPCPNVQIVFVAAIADDHARKLHLGHGFGCHLTVLRPDSIGEVKLHNNDPTEPLLIDPKFFSHENDLEITLAGAKKMQAILESPMLKKVSGKMLYPVTKGSDEKLLKDIHNRADSQYHPVGTCKMAPESDPLGVVDNKLKVRGIKGLRVADASIMPKIVSGNTNAPTIMIGERCAEFIKQDLGQT